MANTVAFRRSITLQAFTVLFVLSVFAADVEGGDGCPRFSCGHLRHVRSPFRRRGDPPECGSQSYELVCSNSKAKILINNTPYYVAIVSRNVQITGVAAICWAIWKLRNRACFEGKLIKSPIELISYACVFMKHWAGINNEQDRGALRMGADSFMVTAMEIQNNEGSRGEMGRRIEGRAPGADVVDQDPNDEAENAEA